MRLAVAIGFTVACRVATAQVSTIEALALSEPGFGGVNFGGNGIALSDTGIAALSRRECGVFDAGGAAVCRTAIVVVDDDHVGVRAQAETGVNDDFSVLGINDGGDVMFWREPEGLLVARPDGVDVVFGVSDVIASPWGSFRLTPGPGVEGLSNKKFWSAGACGDVVIEARLERTDLSGVVANGPGVVRVTPAGVAEVVLFEGQPVAGYDAAVDILPSGWNFEQGCDLLGFVVLDDGDTFVGVFRPGVPEPEIVGVPGAISSRAGELFENVFATAPKTGPSGDRFYGGGVLKNLGTGAQRSGLVRVSDAGPDEILVDSTDVVPTSPVIDSMTLTGGIIGPVLTDGSMYVGGFHSGLSIAGTDVVFRYVDGEIAPAFWEGRLARDTDSRLRFMDIASVRSNGDVVITASLFGDGRGVFRYDLASQALSTVVASGVTYTTVDSVAGPSFTFTVGDGVGPSRVNARGDVLIAAVSINGDPTFESGVFLARAPSCGTADLAEPIGILDLADTDAFISAFLGGAPIADVAAPFGVFDLSDVDAFVASFLSGCP